MSRSQHGSGPRGPSGGRRYEQGGSGRSSAGPPTFDPSKPLVDLVDRLAEEQARIITESREKKGLGSSQLRRFFGDVKDLYRQWQRGADYREQIEPRFKMIRSKASYASRPGSQTSIPREFHEFLDNGVSKVTNEEQFKAFVQHFEAVVGFLYGSGKVGK